MRKFIAGIDIKFEEDLNFEHALWLCTEMDKLAKEKSISVANARISPVHKQIQIEFDCKNAPKGRFEATWLWDKTVNLLKSRELAGEVNILD